MQISSLSTALPVNEYSTEKLMGFFPCKLPESVEQNIRNLGVSKRYLIKREDLSSQKEVLMNEGDLVGLCSEACGKVLKKANLSIKDIGYFIATYDVNPFLSPGLSQLLVPRLGLSPFIKHVNVQGVASTAFPKALELAEDHLAVRPERPVLICVSGVSSYWFQNQVRGLKDVLEIGEIGSIKNKVKRDFELRKWVATMQFFLFGDGVATAVVSKNMSGLEVKKIVEVTNQGEKDYLAGYSRLTTLDVPFRFGFYSHLDKEIPRLGAEYTGSALKELLGQDSERVMKTAKKWAVHTGSEKILNLLAEHNGINREKLSESHEVLKEYGNLAGASLPFILDRIVSGNTLSVGDLVLMVGYGWGFSAAASLLEFTK